MSDAELKDFLIQSGFVSRAQSSILGGDEARRAHAGALGVPFVEVSLDDISADALFLIPEPISRHHNLVAFRETERGVEVALLDLADLAILESLNLPKRFLPRLTSKESMTRALLAYQKALKERYGEAIARALSKDDPDALLDALLRHALHSQAHGIYIEEKPEGVSVYYRIAHALYEAMMLPTRMAEKLFVQLAKLVSAKVDLGEPVRVRGHHSATATGRKSTLHLVREKEGRFGFTLESLGFHGGGLERVHRALQKKSGLVLVCGEQGSGKTTTLYTLLDMATTPARSAATVEEKIEYTFPRVSQTEVDRSLGLTAAAALRAALKHDPDVVLVGELSDAQVALVAVQAAKRGVLVLAGIKAADASSGVEKLLALGVSEELLFSVLRLTIGVALADRLQKPVMRKLTREEERAPEERANFPRTLAALKEEGVVEKSKQWKDMEFAAEGEASGALMGLQEVLDPAAPEEALTLEEDRLFKAAKGEVTVVS